MVVYTYGRYAGTNKGPEGSSNSLANGPGVLLRLTGEEAKSYNDEKENTTGMSVFIITDIADENVSQIFDEKFNSSTSIPDKGKYSNNPSARIIDEYDILGNNCTTIVSEALNSAGSRVFTNNKNVVNRSTGESFNINTKEKIVVPLVMQNYLNSKSTYKNNPVYKSK